MAISDTSILTNDVPVAIVVKSGWCTSPTSQARHADVSVFVDSIYIQYLSLIHI